MQAQSAGNDSIHSEDRGILVLLDRRILERRYGSEIRKSLPDYSVTAELSFVESELQRLGIDD